MSTYPWKNGFWFNKAQPVLIFHVEDNKASMKNLVYFDFPTVPDFMTGTWEHGDFGPAPEKIVEQTGIKNFNLKRYFGGYFEYLGEEYNCSFGGHFITM